MPDLLQNGSPNTTRSVLVALLTSAIVVSAIWVLKPFLPAMIWAVTIAVATWPFLRKMQAILWNSRKLAVSVTIVIAIVVFLLPLWLAVTTVIARFSDLVALVSSLSTLHVPNEPQWLARMPLLGPHIAPLWERLQHMETPQIVRRIVPEPETLIRAVLSYAGSFGMLAIQFLLTLIVLAALLMRAEAAIALANSAATLLAGARGREMLRLAAHTIRGVAVGITVTAVVESIVAWLGLSIAGAPWVSILTAMTFIVCLLQAGPGFTLIPAVIWVYFDRGMGHALLLAIVTVLAIVIDNVLRPFLIRKQANIPLVLIMLGVIGGVGGLGLVGIFVGPLILAVAYTLMQSWISDARPPAQPLCPDQARGPVQTREPAPVRNAAGPAGPDE